VQETENERLLEDDVSLLGQQAHSRFYVLFICEVDLLSQEEALLHRNRKICDPLHSLLPLLGNGPLGEPHAVDETEAVFDDVVEDKIEEHEQLHSHQFVVLCPHHEHPHLRNVRIQNVYSLLCVNRRSNGQHLLPAVYPQKFTVVEHAGLNWKLELRPHLQDR
jgi:hypothetical protein